MTRARKQLWISHCAERFRYGTFTPSTPSQFLSYLPPEHIVETVDEAWP